MAKLIELYRKEDRRVGVVSVDPSSPFSRGAILGDRIRLSDHFLDPGVFIRSMGSRGHLGGLAGASRLAALAMEAAGMDVVLYETVGVGQGRSRWRRLRTRWCWPCSRGRGTRCRL